jgi:hypothetical protein
MRAASTVPETEDHAEDESAAGGYEQGQSAISADAGVRSQSHAEQPGQ